MYSYVKYGILSLSLALSPVFSKNDRKTSGPDAIFAHITSIKHLLGKLETEVSDSLSDTDSLSASNSGLFLASDELSDTLSPSDLVPA